MTSSQVSSESDPQIVFIENSYDPDTSDTEFEALMVYLIREQGKLRIEYDLHYLGIFPLKTWRDIIRQLGVEMHESVYNENDTKYIIFTCVKTI